MNVRKLENSPENTEIEADVRSRSRRVYRAKASFPWPQNSTASLRIPRQEQADRQLREARAPSISSTLLYGARNSAFTTLTSGACRRWWLTAEVVHLIPRMDHIACLMPLIGDGCNAVDRPKTRHLHWTWEQKGRAGAGTEQARKARGVGSAPGPRDGRFSSRWRAAHFASGVHRAS